MKVRENSKVNWQTTEEIPRRLCNQKITTANRQERLVTAIAFWLAGVTGNGLNSGKIAHYVAATKVLQCTVTTNKETLNQI